MSQTELRTIESAPAKSAYAKLKVLDDRIHSFAGHILDGKGQRERSIRTGTEPAGNCHSPSTKVTGSRDVA